MSKMILAAIIAIVTMQVIPAIAAKDGAAQLVTERHARIEVAMKAAGL